MNKVDIGKYFKEFEKNIRTSEDNLYKINTRKEQITKIINEFYWNSSSVKKHSMFVGSYGRGTSIHVSDIDILVELPSKEKERFNSYQYNGQSALLQDVKEKMKGHYSNSQIKGDGQIVSIDFTDGIKFEILPAFCIKNSTKYEYPDSHIEGTWKETNPILEQELMKQQNKANNFMIKRFSRMLRSWNDENNVGIHGIAIDSMVFLFFQTWNIEETTYTYYDKLSKEFFDWLRKRAKNNNAILSIDGSYTINLSDSLESKANTAYERCIKAIQNEDADEWVKIFGSDFPQYAYKFKNEFQYKKEIEMSSRKNQYYIGNAKDTEQFADEKWSNISIERNVDIFTELEMNGFRKGRSIKKFKHIPIKANSHITFSVDKIANVKWFWKIRNVGRIANEKNKIRGQIEKGTNETRQPIKFKGPHYVEVYGVVDNTVKYFGRISVPLEE